MNFRNLAAAVALLASCGSLSAAAAPILDRGAHYIFKFEGKPANAYFGQITGQIVLNAGDYQDGFYARQHINAGFSSDPTILGPLSGLIGMNVTINDFFQFDLQSAQRVAEQKSGLTGFEEKVSSVDLEAVGTPGADLFAAYLSYYTDDLIHSGYYDLQLTASGDATGGTVFGSYGHDGPRGFGCDFGEGGRCTFMTTYAVSVPEPASLALLGTGLVGLMAARRRRKAV